MGKLRKEDQELYIDKNLRKQLLGCSKELKPVVMR